MIQNWKKKTPTLHHDKVESVQPIKKVIKSDLGYCIPQPFIERNSTYYKSISLARERKRANDGKHKADKPKSKVSDF